MRLTRSFALIAGALVLVTCVVLALHQAEGARRDILTAAERYNVSLTRTCGNVLWPRHRELLMQVGAPAADDPRLAAVDLAVRQAMQGLPVVKLKISGLNGRTMFTSGAGEVTVAAACRADGAACISIRDTGSGIAPEDLQRIQTPFAQVAHAYAREVGGIGLVLPIARALTKLHGGTLRLESALGAGTVATVVLPASRVRTLATEAAKSRAA